MGWVAGKAVKGILPPGRRLLSALRLPTPTNPRLPTPSAVRLRALAGLRPLHPVGVEPPPPHPPSLRLRARGALRLRANSVSACWGQRPRAPGGLPLATLWETLNGFAVCGRRGPYPCQGKKILRLEITAAACGALPGWRWMQAVATTYT